MQDPGVAIVGIGLHPFGRHPGLSGLEMGAQAARMALEDARLSWSDIQFAAGGSAAANPNAWRRDPLSVEQILDARMVSDPLTQYMLCSPGEGAAALVLCRGDRLSQVDCPPPVFLRSAALRTRSAGSFDVYSPSLE